jgi:nucleoside-diphosphate-sugar epimerase
MVPRQSTTGQRFLLVGSGGFIGSRVLSRLNNSLMTAENFHLWNQAQDGSFTNNFDREKTFARFRPTTVLSLAWNDTEASDYRSSEENWIWAKAHAEAARWAEAAGMRFITLGSALDGAAAKSEPSTYAESKRWLRQTLSADAPSALLLRVQHVFSIPDMRPHLLREHAAHGIKAILTPLRRHDFIDVADVSDAIGTAVERELTGHLYVGSGQLHTIQNLIECSGGTLPKVCDHIEAPEKSVELIAAGWTPRRTRVFFHSVGSNELD